MMLAKSVSARMPSDNPSAGAKFAGHVATILSMGASSCQRTRFATASPATSRSASTMAPTPTQRPGTLIERLYLNAIAGASCPMMRLSITARGDCTHIRVDGATGHTASTPASDSRTMPLAKDDAALFGLPGRTVTVGNRSERPSMKPLRDMS